MSVCVFIKVSPTSDCQKLAVNNLDSVGEVPGSMNTMNTNRMKALPYYLIDFTRRTVMAVISRLSRFWIWPGVLEFKRFSQKYDLEKRSLGPRGKLFSALLREGFSYWLQANVLQTSPNHQA